MEDIFAAQAAFCFALFFYVIKFMLSNVSTVNGKPPTTFSRPHFFEIIVCS